ncbi:expressed protein [Mycolicibacterium brisbanense]|uniref:Expressed protein n=1 Tax=Mycolicibacterium brisbanense TaxID=146020 RepID=A0A100W4V7_9MYCO|nr:expressed protein [Mycolicibacterium brisbanense]
MLTAVPDTGADGVSAVVPAVAAGACGFIGAMPCIGAIPTEVPPLGPKLTVGGADGWGADGVFEHAASAVVAVITAAATTALVRDRRNMTEPPVGKRCRTVTTR